MSVQVVRSNGKIDSIHIYGEDCQRLKRLLALLWEDMELSSDVAIEVRKYTDILSYLDV